MKLLLIEDDKNTADFLIKELSNEFIRADHAIEGNSGQKMACTKGYDLVLLDVSLPGKSGYQICETMRSFNIQTPVIALSASVEPDTKIKLLNSGADDYVTKPFHFGELLARIKVALRKNKTEAQTMLRLGELVLDLKAHEVRRNGVKIELRQKEFEILEYFMQHPNQVLTRDMIFEHVWEAGEGKISNVVDVHVHYLRSKIDKPFGRKNIKTISNIGYKLVG